MKNVQVSLDDESLAELDRIADEQRKTRTAVVREAIGAWVRQQRIASFEREWIAAARNDGADTSADEWIAAESWDDNEPW